MSNQLTQQQRDAADCPDCGNDPDDNTLHRDGCRRIDHDADGLQFGPPWQDWPDDK